MTRHVVALAIAHLLGPSIAIIPAQKSGPTQDWRWPGDKPHQRVLFVDGGEIVLVDRARGEGAQITRTTGADAEKCQDEYNRILKLLEDTLRTPHNGKAT
jgi:hypothetical protein